MEGRRSAVTEIKTVLGEMQGRIRSMAVLHGLLYQSGMYASVNLGAYLKELAGQAFSSQSSNAGSVKLKFQLASVQVDMDQAMPCGLLVNELVSNCLKHGFPEGHTGTVTVGLQPSPDGTLWQLRVSDTGVGPPPDFREKSSNSLGMQLIADLADQVEGALDISSPAGQGLDVTVTFKIKDSAPAATKP
jgi:two-component sensor histidine kinase